MKIVRGGDDVVHLAEETLALAGVIVTTTQRREHHDDSGFAVGGRGLVIFPGGTLPELVNGVAISAGDPDDGRMLAAITGVRAKVGRQLPDRGIPKNPGFSQ